MTSAILFAESRRFYSPMASQLVLTARSLVAQGAASRLILCELESGRPVLLKATRLVAADVAPSASPIAAVGSSAAARLAREVSLSCALGTDFVVRSLGWAAVPPSVEVYHVLEYLPGGDLGEVLERSGPFGAAAARFYLGCAALGLEHLHAHAVAHRDVKPENIVVGADGYAKLVDLGFAINLGDVGGRAHTLLGTPEYLAPEVFLAEGHGIEADMWALGATLYVLLLDAHPYSGETPQDVYADAMRGEPFFPQRVLPPAARDLISALLVRSPADRPGAAAVWASPFFQAGAFLGADDLGTDAVRSRAAPPPFVPRLRSAYDTRHFGPPGGRDDDTSGEVAGTVARCAVPAIDGSGQPRTFERRACTADELLRSAGL